jgi:cobalt/nickel transport system permease protein
MKHDFIDHHRIGDSIVHKFDPRLKIIVMFFYILAVVLTGFDHFVYLIYLTFFLLILSLMSKISLFHFLLKLMRIYPMFFFVSLLILFVPSSSPVYFQWFFVKVYQDGLQKFILINLKSVIIMLMSLLLMSTTDYMLLLKGLEKFRIPKIFLAILSFLYRFMFLLIDEIERIWMAYRSRYIELSFWKQLNYMGKKIVVLFVRAYERGERIYLSMDARGFMGEIKTIEHLQWRFLDTLYLFFFFCLILGPWIIL